MLRKFWVVGALAALSMVASGCVVRGQVRSAAYVEPAYEPELVMVQPGVYVIADYDEPVFYSDGFYCRYYNGYWSRSYTYTGGWSRVRGVPYRVRSISRPRAYVRYRASGNAHYYRAPRRRGERIQRVERRDHRSRRAPARSRQAPERRDHRRDRPERRDHRNDRNDRRDRRR